jgi:Mn2+/Fe2+ NRAMP family transporter
MVGRPVAVLVLVGAINGLILPVSLGAMLVAAHRARIVGDYRHPLLLTLGGAIVVLAMAMLGVRALLTIDL